MPGGTARRGPSNSKNLRRTVSHMADAVGYLESVAQDAGMAGIAAKLASVRGELVDMAREHDPPRRKTSMRDGGHGM